MAIPIPLGPRTRKLLRYGGVVLATLVVFVFAVQLSLPLDRAKGKIVETLAPKYDVTIDDMEHGFIPGRIYLDRVTLRTRPTKADEPVTTFFVERIRADVGLFALLGGNLSIDLDAKIAAGHISGSVTLPGFGKRGLDVHLTGRDLPGSSLPMRAVVGLPMSGKMEFDVALDLPNETTKTHTGANWQKAEGFLEVSCPSGCVFGDGKTKLKPLLTNTSQQAMVGDGIDFGKLTIDNVVARAEIKDGSLDVTKFEFKSPDGELHVDYAMKLEPNLDDSVVTGCLRFTNSDTLRKREPTTWAALQNTGAERRADGLFHIKLADRFKSMLRLNADCGPNVKPDSPHPSPMHISSHPSLPLTAPESPKPATPSATPAIPPPPGMVTPTAGGAMGSAGSAGSGGPAVLGVMSDAGSGAGGRQGEGRQGEGRQEGEGQGQGGQGGEQGHGEQGEQGSGTAVQGSQLQ